MVRIDTSWYERPRGIRERLAAGGVVVRRHGNRTLVALTQEPDDMQPGYVIPKGGVDVGEDLLRAARREIGEETGLTELVLLGKLGVFRRLTVRRDVWQVIHLFLYASNQIEGVPTDSANHQDMHWAPLDDLPDLFWPEQARLLEERRLEIETCLSCHLAHGP